MTRPPDEPLIWSASYDTVRRLVCAHPAFRRAVAEGLDSDDLRQDVLVAVYARRWDPSRGGLAKYVWLVTSSVCSNARRKHALRTKGREDDPLPDGVSSEYDHLEHDEQLERVCRELGLTDDEVELVHRVSLGLLRRDDGRVLRLVQRVLQRLNEG